METGESLPSMNPNRGPPVLDWSEDPSVVRARTREKHRTAAFTALFLAAGSIVVILSLSDGVGPADALYLPSAGLVWLFGLSALSSLVGFDRTNPGLKVYHDGLALPWRSLKDARRDADNFLAFQSIAEARLLTSRDEFAIAIVRRDGGRPHEFRIESQWIPDRDAFLESLRGHVPVREGLGTAGAQVKPGRASVLAKRAIETCLASGVFLIVLSGLGAFVSLAIPSASRSLGPVVSASLVAGGLLGGFLLLLISQRGIHDIETTEEGLILPLAGIVRTIRGKPRIVPWHDVREVSIVPLNGSRRLKVSLTSRAGRLTQLVYPIGWITDLRDFETRLSSVSRSRP